MAEIGDLVPIDDNNTARWPEGMPPSDVNDAGRADEGIMSRWHRDTNGSLTSTGTSTAYQLTTNQSLTGYYDGLEITFKAHTNSGASPTLQLGALGAISLRWPDYKELVSGDILTDATVNVIYQSGTPNVWQVMNLVKGGNIAFTDRANVFTVSPQTIDGGVDPGQLFLDTGRSSGAIGQVIGLGKDSGSNSTAYAQMVFRAEDNTDGAEDGLIALRSIISGSEADRFLVKSGVYTAGATGGDLGLDTINAGGVFKNGVEYQDGWTYTDIVNLSGSSSLLATESGNPGLAAALEIEVLGDLVASSSSSNPPRIRLGTGGAVVSTGYVGSSSANVTTVIAVSSITDSFPLVRDASYSSSHDYGFVGRIARWDSSLNLYMYDCISNRADSGDTRINMNRSRITLTGTLDRVAIEANGGAILSGQARVRFR